MILRKGGVAKPRELQLVLCLGLRDSRPSARRGPHLPFIVRAGLPGKPGFDGAAQESPLAAYLLRGDAPGSRHFPERLLTYPYDPCRF